LKNVKLTLIEILYTNFFFFIYWYMWFQSLQSSSFAKPLFPESSFTSSQLSSFSSYLLFTALQPLFLLLSPFPLLLVLLSSWIDCNKSQHWFIFLKHLHSCYIPHPFFLSLHLEIENITCTWGHPPQPPCNNVFFLWWNFTIFQQRNWDFKKKSVNLTNFSF